MSLPHCFQKDNDSANDDGENEKDEISEMERRKAET